MSFKVEIGYELMAQLAGDRYSSIYVCCRLDYARTWANRGASTPGGGQASSGQAVSHKANAYAEQQAASRSASGATGRSGSHSENWSHNEGWNQSNNWQTSSSAQYGYNVSQYTNNVREIANTAIGALNNAFNGAGSAVQQGRRDAQRGRTQEWRRVGTSMQPYYYGGNSVGSAGALSGARYNEWGKKIN